ncbi:MAG: hypothetical protein RR960_06535 [Alistipes sp.]
MKSDIEIRDLLYKAIKGSALEKAVSGKLYKTERPTNSGVEDIVISILDGLNGQIQDAVINVNIYVQDVNRGADTVENEPRIRELSRLAILLLEEVDDGDYHFEIEKQKCFKVNGVDEHCINNRIKLQITNF